MYLNRYHLITEVNGIIVSWNYWISVNSDLKHDDISLNLLIHYTEHLRFMISVKFGSAGDFLVCNCDNCEKKKKWAKVS